jgi:TPR repeat protein
LFVGWLLQEAAYERFERAADGGHVPAQNGLGVMNLHGQGNTTRNATKARKFFQMAADQGDGDGMANLAAMLSAGDVAGSSSSAPPAGSTAAERDAAKLVVKGEAFQWAKRAAHGGHTKASVLLGDFYRDGVGVAPDAESAAWMYRQVAERAPTLGLVLRQALEWQMIATGPSDYSLGITAGAGGGGATQVEKTGFLSYLYIKIIFLPRQARDKHRENSKKARFFEAGG